MFGSARDAIRAAVELQDRFVTEAVRDADMPLLVGIGIDVGEAVPVEGGYRGGALNLAARLCSLAAPGEILASTIATHLAGPMDGIDYEDRGETRLKGLRDPVPVMRVWPARRPDAAGCRRARRRGGDAGRGRRRLGAAARGRGPAAEGVGVHRSRPRPATPRSCWRRSPPTRRTSCVVDIRMPPTYTDEGLRRRPPDPRAAPRGGGAAALAVRRDRLRASSWSRPGRPGSATCSRTGSPTSRSSPTPYAGSARVAR